jgi:hypothetical protein
MKDWRSAITDREPRLPSWSKRSLFATTKPGEQWHQQIDFTAGTHRPSESTFQWELIKRHTDHYIKKKGYMNQAEIDVKLSSLIEQHAARDVAIAACAHAMSPKAVRALLNVQLDVAPTTLFGLETYLQSLIAANQCSPTSVTQLEALWARHLLPYTASGSDAARRYLEGIIAVLWKTSTQSLNDLPDFAALARRAFRTLATQLEGMKLRCDWVAACDAVAWMTTIAQSTRAPMPHSSRIVEHLMDVQLPLWRVWANWKPNIDRLVQLGSVDTAKKGVLVDMMALEGPDFIDGTQDTLRNGIVKQYTTGKSYVRYRGLVVEVKSGTKEELRETLEQTGVLLERAIKMDGYGAFPLFSHLAIATPITRETLHLLQAVGRIRDTPKFHIHNAILEIYPAQQNVGGRHIVALQHLICALDDARGDELRKVMLRPWFVQGIEKCFKECQAVLEAHIRSECAWTHLALEFHTFCAIVKDSRHCLPLLNHDIREEMGSLPGSTVLRTLLDIYAAAGDERNNGTDKESSVLKDAITEWCIDRFLQHGSLSHASQRTIDVIVKVWDGTSTKGKRSSERRSLALSVSASAGTDFVLRIQCLNQILGLPDDFVSSVLLLLQTYKTTPEHSCMTFTRILSKSYVDVTSCWKQVLFKMLHSLQPTAIIEYSLRRFTTNQFLSFVLELNALFTDANANPKAPPPFILQSHFHSWVQQLWTFLPTITKLEIALGKKSQVVGVILKGGEGLLAKHLVKILEALATVSDRTTEVLMQKAVGKLSKERQNASEIADFVDRLGSATSVGIAACERIWDASHHAVNTGGIQDPEVSNSITSKPVLARQEAVPIAVAEVIVAGWLQNGSVAETDKTAIIALAFLLKLEIYLDGVPQGKLVEATVYFEKQEAKMIEELRSLEDMTKVLKARDPHGTKILLEQLGVDYVDALDEELEALSVTVAGAVEKCSDNEVEISFPLLEWTDLQRSGMGVGEASTLLVRLFLDPLGNMPTSFCVHLDTDERAADVEHTPWTCLTNTKAPEKLYCLGGATLLTWHVSRIVFDHLMNYGAGIADLHRALGSKLNHLAHSCPVCSRAHITRNTQLRRSRPCSLGACTRIWNNIPLDVRIPNFRSDLFAVDMLLTTVYAAALSSRPELLPGCPITNTAVVMAILNALPTLKSLQNVPSLSASLRTYHRDAEKLIVWALTHFRGFVATATGICKVPGMPVGTHQFVLANAAPFLETAFATCLSKHNSKTTILFHGTSLDRLPSILTQGLRIQSGTSLQRTGAAHGKGIYLAEEPSTSFSYSPAAVSWRNSSLNGMRLLLGCEVAGIGRSVSPGIHVLQDERSVLVRYVFLLGSGCHAPSANHVVPAMGSAINALRSGAL